MADKSPGFLTVAAVTIGKARAACAQSFALWQQATMEIMRCNRSIIACSRHVYLVLFFAHIPFVVNHTFNATPPERLQHCCMLGWKSCEQETSVKTRTKLCAGPLQLSLTKNVCFKRKEKGKSGKWRAVHSRSCKGDHERALFTLLSSWLVGRSAETRNSSSARNWQGRSWCRSAKHFHVRYLTKNLKKSL